MPRYFFDIHDGRANQDPEYDDEGVLFANSEAAAKYTRAFLPEIAAHEASKGDERHTYTVLVRD